DLIIFLRYEGETLRRLASAIDEIENTLVRTLSNVSLAQVADETQYNYNLGYLDEWIDEMD
ncbi:hypothetical protein ACI3RH_12605, partial [Lactococcus lactis]